MSRRVTAHAHESCDSNVAHWLNTTRSSSQICRSWRRALLASTSIWANLVNFNSINKYRSPKKWLNLIFARAHGHGLYVFGKLTSGKELLTFLDFISERWSSISILHIALCIETGLAWSLYSSRCQTHRGWVVMRDEVSPALEYFFIDTEKCFVESYQATNLNPRNPNVQQLYVSGFSQIGLPRAEDLAFLSNLCNLSIRSMEYLRGRGSSFPWTHDDVLNILRSTPLLRYLELGDEVLAEPTNRNLPTHLIQICAESLIILPHLRFISLTASTSTCLALLSMITPASAGCGLRLDCSNHPDEHDFPDRLSIRVFTLEQLILQRYMCDKRFTSPIAITFINEDYDHHRYILEHSAPVLHVFLEIDLPSPILDSIFPKLMLEDTLDYTNVKQLALDLDGRELVDPDSRLQLLRDVYQRFPQVTSLHLPLDFLPEFFSPFGHEDIEDKTTMVP
ncbi:hypothetical protein CPB83DRAFT_926283 [Crepidotus variabilis]|uniref:F-box domain-containing protein n=1 Tax=Crepidotus variabilis TaxID=179855 RepID=A0A9P6EI72_9AGAR|nr:hypothetical protein CPB83DRAFT_926283 [Crepidotus variabilis]